MATATQVPLLSFAVTDPSFSEHQYPYFFRIAHSDADQMEAIAALIAMYKWRDVVAIYIDDESGSSGAAALSDSLEPRGVRVAQKVALRADINLTSLGAILTDLSTMQTRVFVLHMPQNLSLLFFTEAKYQGMMTSGYVWIASDLAVGTLNSAALKDNAIILQGVIGIRGYFDPKTPEFEAFYTAWTNNQTSVKKSEDEIGERVADEIPVYGLYAYDATQMLTRALVNYTNGGHNITFRNSTFPSLATESSLDLVELKVFDGGPLLRSSILQTQFMGTSRYIQVDSSRDLMHSAFEIVNIVAGEMRTIGYWTNETKLSSYQPGNTSASNTPEGPWKMLWPGDSNEVPRGWVFPKNGKPLRIAVPLKKGFEQFLSYSKSNTTNVTTFRGYCIDIFLEALKLVPYTISYNFELFGNDTEPIYDDMIDQLAKKVWFQQCIYQFKRKKTD
jgi:ionotropic glutamate receptor